MSCMHSSRTTIFQPMSRLGDEELVSSSCLTFQIQQVTSGEIVIQNIGRAPEEFALMETNPALLKLRMA